MALPTSPVEICNIAADLCGERAISSISPPSTETEKLFARHYDEQRQQLLRQGVWNFAATRMLISRNTTDPEFDYADAYDLPVDCLRVLSVGDIDFRGSTQFVVEGRQILMNNSGADSLKLRYIKDVTDVTKWDAGFRRLMVIQLALQVAYQITKKEKIIERLEALLRAEWKGAFSIDGQETPPTRIQNSKYLTARRLNQNNVASQYTVFE